MPRYVKTDSLGRQHIVDGDDEAGVWWNPTTWFSPSAPPQRRGRRFMMRVPETMSTWTVVINKGEVSGKPFPFVAEAKNESGGTMWAGGDNPKAALGQLCAAMSLKGPFCIKELSRRNLSLI
jgi:hypothetical protein